MFNLRAKYEGPSLISCVSTDKNTVHNTVPCQIQMSSHYTSYSCYQHLLPINTLQSILGLVGAMHHPAAIKSHHHEVMLLTAMCLTVELKENRKMHSLWVEQIWK